MQDKILYVDAVQQYEAATGLKFDAVKATEYFQAQGKIMQPKSVCADCFMGVEHTVCP